MPKRACGFCRWRTGSGRPRRGSSGHVARHSVTPESSAPRLGRLTRADAARAASSASVCEHLPTRRSGAGAAVIRERAAGVILRLRLRHRSCSTTGSFEARLHETPGHHFETRAVPRALGSARRPASLLRVCANSLSTRNQDAQADCTLCRLPAWSFASLYVDVATCRLPARLVRPTPNLITVRFETMLQMRASPMTLSIQLRAPASTFGLVCLVNRAVSVA